MRISKEEYKKAKGYLKRYKYNRIKIKNIRNDLMSLNAVNIDGLPKSKYSRSDSVSKSVIKLQENKSLQEALKEYNIVEQALLLVNNDSKNIFNLMYIEGKTKWEIIDKLSLSERTFARRYKDLIYAVCKEIKNFGIKLA